MDELYREGQTCQQDHVLEALSHYMSTAGIVHRLTTHDWHTIQLYFLLDDVARLCHLASLWGV